MTSTHVLRKAAVLLAGLAAVSACTSAPATTAATATATASAAEKWQPASADKRLLSAAEELLLADCMKRAGFSYQPRLLAAIPENRPFPYGIDDLDWAARNGYGIAAEIAASRRPNPNRVALRAKSPAEQQRYADALQGTGHATVSIGGPAGGTAGTNSDGCLADARRRLYANHDGWFRSSTVADNLDSTVIVPKVVESTELRAVLRQWATCMRSAGHPDPDPQAARERIGRLADQVPLNVLRRTERAVATAEARCATQTGLVRTAERVDRELGVPARTKYRDALQEYRRLLTAAVPRARALLKGR